MCRPWLSSRPWTRTHRPLLGTGQDATRWAPLLGSSLGLTVGFFLPTPIDVNLLTDHLLTAAIWFAAISLGVSAFGAALADMQQDVQRRTIYRVPSNALAVLGAAAAAAGGLSAVVSVQQGHFFDLSGAADRITLIHAGDTGWQGWTPAFFLVAVVALLTTSTLLDRPGPPGGRPQPAERPQLGSLLAVAAAAVITCTVIASLLTQKDVARKDNPRSMTGDSIIYLENERWWLCGLAGALTVLTVLLLIRRTRLGQALLIGAVVTIVTGCVQAGQDLILGDSRSNLKTWATS